MKMHVSAQELNFRVEAANAVRCAANFASETSAVRGQVAIPEVRTCSSRCMLWQSRLFTVVPKASSLRLTNSPLQINLIRLCCVWQ